MQRICPISVTNSNGSVLLPTDQMTAGQCEEIIQAFAQDMMGLAGQQIAYPNSMFI